MSDVEQDLRVRVDSFVDELSALIRRQALLAVEDVLGKGEGVAPGRRGRRGRATTEVAVGARGRGRLGRALVSARRKPGEKRSPHELARITDQVFSYIKSNGTQGVEQIAKGLGTSTKELTLPIRKLLREKKLGSKGQKRATRYFAR
jgi:hypothetical protein